MPRALESIPKRPHQRATNQLYPTGHVGALASGTKMPSSMIEVASCEKLGASCPLCGSIMNNTYMYLVIITNDMNP